MAKKTHATVTKILKGRPFHEQPKRFDDGGSAYSSYADYSGDNNLDYITPSATYMTGDNSGAPTAADIAGLTSSATTDIPNQISSEIASNPADLNPSGGASTGSSTGSSSGSAGSGALSSLLKALGLGGGQGSSSASGLAAIAGLLAAAGQYKQNSALAPKFSPPPMFGGAPGSAAPTSGSSGGLPPASNGGYGPPGGYNYKNYAGATSGTTGLGYAPRTAVNPNIPNYYTYGQQPQSTFFSSGTPPVGTPPTSMVGAVSPGMKRGGHVKKFMIGGFAGPMPKPQVGMPPMSGVPNQSVLGGPLMPQRTHLPPRQGIPINPVPRPVMGPQPVMGPRPVMRAGGGSIMPLMMANAAYSQSHPQEHSMTLGEIAAALGHARDFTAEGISRLADKVTNDASYRYDPNKSQNKATGGHMHLPPQSQSPGLPPQSRHVQGPGDGTSDSIPARLATGEYVQDAQLVSMIGNGDNGAGAKALDKFRENIRKHKGGSLANGKMAPDTHKDLTKYLPKGTL